MDNREGPELTLGTISRMKMRVTSVPTVQLAMVMAINRWIRGGLFLSAGALGSPVDLEHGDIPV